MLGNNGGSISLGKAEEGAWWLSDLLSQNSDGKGPQPSEPRSALAGRITQPSACARERYPIAPAPTATLRRCPTRSSPVARPLPD